MDKFLFRHNGSTVWRTEGRSGVSVISYFLIPVLKPMLLFVLLLIKYGLALSATSAFCAVHIHYYIHCLSDSDTVYCGSALCYNFCFSFAFGYVEQTECTYTSVFTNKNYLLESGPVNCFYGWHNLIEYLWIKSMVDVESFQSGFQWVFEALLLATTWSLILW